MKAHNRQSGFVHIWTVVIFIVVFAALSIFVFRRINQSKLITAAAVETVPLSRQVMLVAQEQVKAQKPPPTEAARQYAYVASAYKDALASGGQAAALEASAQVLDMLYPTAHTQMTEEMRKLAQAYKLELANSSAATAVANTYQTRNNADNHGLAWDGIIPTGPGKWVKQKPVNPFTPRAGDWQRWVVSQPISVQPPPVLGSAEDNRELSIVQQAVANRNGDDVNKINFWGGTPGTESPSGIWQNQVYKTIKGDLPKDPSQADKVYADIQADVAQTMSDAFMECWKVKYIYWTARPSMRIPGLATAMDDPNFPSYISGHSTISKAAADVLSVLVPQHAVQWQAMAVEARDSRLKAGIHFEVDNTAGFAVGAQVGAQVIAAKKLTKVL